jgi:hypothetical protein
LASKKTAAILTIVGGVFYILGGVVIAALLGSLSSLTGSDGSGGCLFSTGGLIPCTSSGSDTGLDLGLGSGSMTTISDGIIIVGFVTGLLIIFGGVLINSNIPGRRKAGGILAIVMILLGSLTTGGGLLVGFILGGIGAYLGLTYKSSGRGMTFGLGPVGSVTLGSRSPVSSSTPAGSGPLNYCIKCGSQIRPGAVFCGACGARVVD